MQFLKGKIIYSSSSSTKLFSSLYYCSNDSETSEYLNLNKKELGLNDVAYIDLQSTDENEQHKMKHQNKACFLFEPKHNGPNMMRCSLVNNKLLNVNIIPHDMQIIIQDNNKVKTYNGNDLEYYITKSAWASVFLDQVVPIRYKHKYEATQNFMVFMANEIDPKNTIMQSKFFAISTILEEDDESQISLYKFNETNEQEVYCAIENDKLIGLSDMHSKDKLEAYFL